MDTNIESGKQPSLKKSNFGSKFFLFVLFVIILIIIISGANLFLGKKNIKPSSIISPSPAAVHSLPLHISPPVPTPGTSDNGITGQVSCSSDTDCKKGESCQVTGPIIAHQPIRKVCVRRGQMLPM